MSKTSIEWTDYSWNPIRARNIETGKIGWHCEHASEGCRFCYSETFNRRLGTGLDFKPGHRKDIEIFLDEKMLLAPLKWKAPRKIFVCSMTDLGASFVTDAMLDRIFAVAALCPQHTFIMLTKRPERMREYLTRREFSWAWSAEWRVAEQMRILAPEGFHFKEIAPRGIVGKGIVGISCWPLPNVWIGTSCEDQSAADERVPHLLAAPAAVRFLSCEPLLGPIDLRAIALDGATMAITGYSTFNALTGIGKYGRDGHLMNWIIVGGESGRNARPMHPDWARSLRDQCAAAHVPFFFKQWGEFAPGEVAGDFLDPEKAAKGQSYDGKRWGECWSFPDGHAGDEPDVYRVGKANAGRKLDGFEHNGFPT